MATLVAAVSMAATPMLFALSERFVIPRLEAEPAPEYDTIDAADAPVIICGFGRFGQIIGRVLRMHGIAFTALERDPGQVDVVRRFGNKVYFGDPTRADMLRVRRRRAGEAADGRAGRSGGCAARRRSGEARLSAISKILARARNRRHAHLLMDRGVDGLVRETFYSSLKLAESADWRWGSREAAARGDVVPRP